MFVFFFSKTILGASLVAQIVKNPPAVEETRVQFLGWEDTLEKGMFTHSSIFPWRIPWSRPLIPATILMAKVGEINHEES